MPIIRTVIKKRVGPEGIEVECEANVTHWVDIKETKKARYERGRGPAYQKTIYEHINDSTLRRYDPEEEPVDDEADKKITFKNPENESQKIEYSKDKDDNHGTIRRMVIECGRGPFYSKKILEFENTEENTKRKVRVQRVENQSTGDYIDVERITHYTVKQGRGPAYQQKRVEPTNEEEDIENSEGDCKEIEEE